MSKILLTTLVALSVVGLCKPVFGQEQSADWQLRDLRPRCFGPAPYIWPARRGEVFGPWRQDIYVDAPVDGGDWPRPVPCVHLRSEPYK